MRWKLQLALDQRAALPCCDVLEASIYESNLY